MGNVALRIAILCLQGVVLQMMLTSRAPDCVIGVRDSCVSCSWNSASRAVSFFAYAATTSEYQPCVDGLVVCSDGQFCDETGSQSGGKLKNVCRLARIGYFIKPVSTDKYEFPCGNNYTTASRGTFTSDSSAVAQAVCVCQAGFGRAVANATSERCTACAPGKYKVSIGNEALADSCLQCQAGSYLNTVAWTPLKPNSQRRCFTCGEQQYNSTAGAYGPSRKEGCTCRAGYGRIRDNDVTTVCTTCPAGSFKSDNSNTKCTPCPAGKYTPVSGATVCLSCPVGQDPPVFTGVGYSVCGTTFRPSGQPTSQPSRQPSGQPTSQPSFNPTGQPTCKPSIPTSEPSGQPSRQPSGQPTSSPTGQPTGQPTQPTGQPTSRPTTGPTGQPTMQPSSPTSKPTTQPSNPTFAPTFAPTNPTSRPTRAPLTSKPTYRPSSQPTRQPTSEPSGQPSSQPSSEPSGQPTTQPTKQPSGQPTSRPSSPSSIPTGAPSSVPSIMPDYSPKFKDLWWRNSFYLTMLFAGLFGSCCCVYHFSTKKLTLKYLLMKFCGWDEPKDTGNWLFCLNKPAGQIEKEKVARERLEAVSYIPLDQDSLEAGRRAVLDGTVQKKKRVPNTQNKKLQQLLEQQAAAAAAAASPSFSEDGKAQFADSDDGAVELTPAVRTDDRGEADKIRFEHKAGTSETVYKGGRLKQRAHMIVNNLQVVENFKKTANATISSSTVSGEVGEGQVSAHGEQEQGQEEEHDESHHSLTATEDGTFHPDQDSAEYSGQGYPSSSSSSAAAAATATLSNVMRTLFSSPRRSTAKVAPVAVGDRAADTVTGTASAPAGRRSSLTAQLKGAARKVIQHRAVESNPLDDDW